MPFAEVVPSPHLHKFLLRGCSCRPHGKDTLCQKHAAARDKQLPPVPPSSQVARHRLRKALHTHGDVCHFEVQIAGFRGWQPACTINADVLAQHFASRADSNIRRRRERRVRPANRGGQALGHAVRALSGPLAFRGSKATVPRLQQCFLFASLCLVRSPVPCSRKVSDVLLPCRSSCKTHKESEKEAHAAARSAGYLFAVSESGLLFDMLEIIGAESLSQRYHFAAQVAHRLPRLQTIVHDDACHLKAMCHKERQTSAMAARLADMDFIIDHSTAGDIAVSVQNDLLAQPASQQRYFERLPNRSCRISQCAVQSPWPLLSSLRTLVCPPCHPRVCRRTQHDQVGSAC